jgi:hypothetical protein
MAGRKFTKQPLWPRTRRPRKVTEEVKAGVLITSPAVRILTEHELRLLGVQLQAQGPEPLSNRGPQFVGLILGVAMGYNIVGITLERTARELPVHPSVERIVHEEIG